MKYLLVPDKFKGSATAKEVVNALITGIKRVDSAAIIDTVVASDGGDGFLDTVAHYASVSKIQMESQNAYGQTIDSYYLYDQHTHTAYIELANTVGIALLKNQPLDILKSSTYGMGLQIKAALKKGAKNIYLGIGGSASTDAGLGIMHALGFVFYNSTHSEITPSTGNLHQIQSIQFKEYADISFYAVNDVDNPLYGPLGASHIFAPQKGADQHQVEFLDQSLIHIAELLKSSYSIDVAGIKGAGAAGGTAFGLKAFLNATFINGFDFLTEVSGLNQKIQTEHYDYLITGEGQFDTQSLQGKLIDGLLRLTKTSDIKTIIVCGSNTIDQVTLDSHGINAVLQIKKEDRSLEYCLTHTEELISSEISQYLKSN